MSHLREILIESASEDDLIWIDKIAGFSYYEETTKNLLERGLKGEVKFWRFQDGCDGILAGRIVSHFQVREFWIEFIHGTGLISKAQEIHDDIWELATLADCNRVSGIAYHKALARVYERVLKVPPSGTIFSEGRRK